MKVGITGTREGMTEKQKKSFSELVNEIPIPFELHHGDCVGVDDEAATIVHEAGSATIVVHPPTDDKLQAGNPYGTFTMEAKSYFARNRDIVDAVELLIVVPLQSEHQIRGGTWKTHDYAVKKNKRIITIWPDGTLTERKP